MKTQKTIADKNGKPTLRIDETLEAISKDRYQGLRASLLK